MLQHTSTRCVVFLCALLGVLSSRTAGGQPSRVILCIGDGMGFEQVDAASLYAHGATGRLFFEALPHRAELRTYSASSAVTDSAAAATAIATGSKVSNGVISMAIPGDGAELETLLERAKLEGRSTGLVTTTYMTHATPAAFGAHEPSRDRLSAIAGDYLGQTRPDVLLGGGGNGLSISGALAAGYVVVETRAELFSLDTSSVGPVSGQFGTTHLPYELDGVGGLPHLSEMTSTALDILDEDPDGFLLVVEGGRIDHACHSNDIERAVHEVLEFDRAVRVATEWAHGRDDTILLVTADHETGGLDIVGSGGIGVYPTVTWSTTGHTAANVPVYATGVNAELVGGTMDNTDIVGVVTFTAPGRASSPVPEDGASEVPVSVVLSWTPGEGAVSHDVYFGAALPPPFAGARSAATFDPGPLLPDATYFWRVDELSSAGVTTGDVWSFTTEGAPEPVEVVATGEYTTSAVVARDYTATWVGDGNTEDLTEVLAGGRKPARARSTLEHTWTLEVPPGVGKALELLGHHTKNLEGDDFLFSYSTDGSAFTDMFVLQATETSTVPFSYNLPAEIGGTLHLRVADTDGTRGSTVLDTLFVDRIAVRGVWVDAAPSAATLPVPADGEEELALAVVLRWLAGERAEGHDVYLGTTPDSLAPVATGLVVNMVALDGLLPSTTYFWRVDEVNGLGRSAGAVWSFATGDGVCRPTAVWIGSVVESSVRSTGARIAGQATVFVVDDCAEPVAGASVTGHFEGDFSGEAPQTQLTDADGRATFTTATSLKKPAFSFVVDDVVAQGLEWAP